ncbi:hypothetical protein [Flavobacterium urocaniciphilum]|uniref:Uncharacterized protein n=1 Tax=Flavobacterium urocaniciphilum TaxID=1299341 RepID=A0A1H9D5Y4_9FLAO|nr:hypothetical protein [Flavobacterium urocaniciphilum]SEQ08218.1 hypothetical protein SAMN05444005_10621 [Flavobacterium urocaniciphilum]
MIHKINKFYTSENRKRKLKEKYLLSYSFSPGFYDKLCSMNLYIDKNYDYELFLFFHEKNLKDFFTSNKSARIFLNLKSKLPYKIRKEVYGFFESDIILKENYYNDKNVFGISDSNETTFDINHKNGYFSLNMTLDILDKNLFQSKNEIKFLKLNSIIEKWCHKLRDDLMKEYGHKKNGI